MQGNLDYIRFTFYYITINDIQSNLLNRKLFLKGKFNYFKTIEMLYPQKLRIPEFFFLKPEVDRYD